MDSPRVSIILPTFRRVALLKQAVATILCQSLGDWEAILVDDGSPAEERAAIRELAGSDGRLKYHERPDSRPQGACASRNVGLEAARASHILFLDSDDALHPDCLAERLAVADRQPHADFLVFPTEVFKDTPGDQARWFNVPTPDDDLLRWLRLEAPWQTGSVLWRRGAIDRLGPWDESLPSWQDWELHLRALCRGFRYHLGAGGLSYWREPSGSTIGKASLTPGHLRSHERLLERMITDLAGEGLLNGARSAAIGGLHLRLALSWRDAGHPAEARRLWALAHQRGFATRIQHAIGLPILRLHGPGFRAYRKFLKTVWPPGLFPWHSPTMYQVPTDVPVR